MKEQSLPRNFFTGDLYNYKRRDSSEVNIGSLVLGGKNPIALQSMTTTSTMDKELSVKQVIEIKNAGADLIRLTAQGVRESKNLENIKLELKNQGVEVPLSADIHFNPKAAFEAVLHVEKVRINPGNFVSDENKIEETFVPLLQLCKEHNKALRIGVNHGSLAERMLSKYGDTPLGMVESCMEFLRICQRENFHNVVVSMKSSNTMVMVESVRLLVANMLDEKMNYPLHLGVTEAGDGEDGRIKSAVGIGALLCDGIGDTIRVSLSEHPALEIPVAKQIVEHVSQFQYQSHINVVGDEEVLFNPYAFSRRNTDAILNVGGGNVPIVIADASSIEWKDEGLLPDFIYVGTSIQNNTSIPQIVNLSAYEGAPNTYPLLKAIEIKEEMLDLVFVHLYLHEIDDENIEIIKGKKCIILFHSTHTNPVGEIRAALNKLRGLNIPFVVWRDYTKESNLESFQLKAAVDNGVLFLDGLLDGLLISNGSLPIGQVISTEFGILQGSRARTSKTEYISCPSCGRTLFNLQEVIARIKEATSHLVGLKIGIMGCIVNGPGEMADADYGYVGAAPHKINIYKGRECVEKNIPEEEAVGRLISLIKKHGDWKDKE